LGAVTNNIEGKELAEMYDMRNSGAVAFSDGLHCIQSSGLLLKALQYVKAFEGVIIQVPEDKTIGAHGLMNEGIASTRLGLAGKPSMAEELMVERDINLAQYTNSSIHLTGISTRRSLDYISKAKKEGIRVSCSVTPAHLIFCDEDVSGYDSLYKLNPPLRTREEREALKQAILNGEIDCLASHHLPHENDSKVLEFEYAKPGITGLETAFAVLSTAVEGLGIEKIIEMLAINPRRIFKMEAATIKEGNLASITLFDPGKKWTLTEKDIKSLSRNTPFIGRSFKGKSLGIINNGLCHLTVS
jgi:dihydroorotase